MSSIASGKCYKHSGDLGDIIYALPSLENGCELLLCFDDRLKYHKTKFNEKGYNAIYPLLRSQDIDIKPYTGQKFDIDLDLFRFEKPTAGMNLIEWQARWLGIKPNYDPWIELEGWANDMVLINITPRYQNKNVKIKFDPNMVFIGVEEEWKEFEKNYFRVPFLKTMNLYEAAMWIKGCHNFIGNQSSLFAIAVGLGVDAELIVSHYAPNCIFERDNIIYHH